MNTLKAKLVRELGKVPEYVPDWSKPVLRPFSGIYSRLYRAIYSSIKEEELVKTPMGPYIYVRWWDCVERGCALGTWERRYMELFCSKIKEGDVVVDVGAYIGYFSLLASERVGDKGCVYAFELVPRNFERLMRNLKVNQVKNVKAYNFGLSDRDEVLPIYVPKDNPAEATLYQSNVTEISKGNVKKDVIEARLKQFDQFYNEEGLNRVNIVKIDAEGAELKILRGMKDTLKSNNLTLFIEIFPPLIEHIGGSVGELITFLTNYGFKKIYSVKLDSEISINMNNVNKVVKFIKDGAYNFILSKNGGGIKW